MAKQLAGLLCDGAEDAVAEGQEAAEFWDLLGGKAPYASSKRLQQVQDVQSRLFECSNKTGRFTVTEITDFTQDDLNPGDVMLLDTWDQQEAKVLTDTHKLAPSQARKWVHFRLRLIQPRT
ncbi:PREDICTED: advillin isoform X3 [Condylura cristata]|uniref:advillin isoform X3 n=1 Tax=Condylura cristata TaxID=143302 RepID=UPI000643129D|nr:PREDICTED: advillin isoform X3 [Condylura cristata]